MDAVDMALVLGLDGSASVDFDEFDLMTRAIGAAFQAPDVIAGLLGGERRASFACSLLWSGTGAQEVLVDWTPLTSAEDAHSFGRLVADAPRLVRPGATAIGDALLAAARLLVRSPVPSARQVVNFIGDGRSNEGIPPGPVRDRLAGAGVTINGLCLLHEEPDVLRHYETEVIGGPGAFALPCPDPQAFAEAMRLKLLRELTS